MTRRPGFSRTRLALLAIVGVLLLAGSGGALYAYRSRAAEKSIDHLPRIAVRRAGLHPTLHAGGRVESTRRTIIECKLENLSYSNEGRSIAAGGSTILELIPEGTTVRKGDVLCRLDASAYEELVLQQEIKLQQVTNDYDKAELDVRMAEMALVEFQKGLLPQQLQAMDSQMVLAEAEIARQADRLTWTERMVKHGYLSEGQLTSEKDRMLRSQVQLRNLQGEKLFLQRFRAPITVQKLEMTVASARSLLAFQELRRRRMTTQMEKFRLQVENCTVRAPHNGFVIYANESFGTPRVEVGTRVFQRMKLFFLPDLAQMDVKAVVNESVVDRVHQNQMVRVRIEGLSNAEMEGHVVSVDPLPTSAGPIPGWSDVRNYISTIRLHNTPRGLLPGMSAEVAIATGGREPSLVVPTGAIVAQGDREYCYVDGRSGIERREVEIGQGTRDLVEVKSGLDEGEQVIGDPSLIDGGEIVIASSASHADDESGDDEKAPAAK